jgi:hypothetical protein
MHRARESTAPEMTMRILAAILSVAVLMWVEAAGAQTTYRLSVSRHTAVPDLTDEDVRRILADASKMLQKGPRDGHNDNDVACNVTLTLDGPVRTFPRDPPPPALKKPIVKRANIRAFHRVDSDVAGVDFHVKVVDQIKFCRRGVRGSSQGCSFSPPDFRSIIVVHPKSHKVSNYPDHLLWAHEFGHLTGLGHRDDDPLALMTRCPLNTQFFNISDDRVRVNSQECDRLRAGPGVEPPPPLEGTPACRSPR